MFHYPFNLYAVIYIPVAQRTGTFKYHPIQRNSMGYVNRINLVQDRDHLWTPLNKVMDFWVPFLD
jgi:hypothetical protein